MSIFISSKTFMVEARVERSRVKRERGDSYLVFRLSLGGCSVPASLLPSRRYSVSPNEWKDKMAQTSEIKAMQMIY